VIVPRRVLDDIRSHAAQEAPRECCGVLIGADDRVLESVRAGNLAGGVSRFEIDPRDHIRAIREARARSLDVIGFYHSHPRSPAYPSETDVAEAGYAGVVHLIAGVGANGEEARLFRIDGAQILELRLEVADS
jgi:proteasome lid subunit RPN8/RPN11